MPPETKPAPARCLLVTLAGRQKSLSSQWAAVAFILQLTKNKGSGRVLRVVLGVCFWGPEFPHCPWFS